MGLNILELIVSPIQPVPVQGLFLTSTCSTPFFFHPPSLRLRLPHLRCASFLLSTAAEDHCCPPFPVLIAPVGSELRERIIEGFEPSSSAHITHYPLLALHLLTQHAIPLPSFHSRCPSFFSSPCCYSLRPPPPLIQGFF